MLTHVQEMAPLKKYYQIIGGTEICLPFITFNPEFLGAFLVALKVEKLLEELLHSATIHFGMGKSCSLLLP